MANIFRALATEKAPFVVTLWFAASGWIVQHSINQVLASPTVMYVEDRSQCGDAAGCLTVTITNITRSIRFRGLRFDFLCPQQEQCSPKATKEPVPPAWDVAEPVDNESKSSSIPIGALQPGWSFKFTVRYSGTVPPSFHLEASDDPTRLVPASLETSFAQHEFRYLSILLILYLIFAIIVICFQGSPAPP